MAHLALYLLGPFRAELDGIPVRGLNSAHLRALLAYLAVERGRQHSREALASLLWPERPDREALTALRCALANLRSALGDRTSPSPILLITRSSVQFNAASDHWLDVAEFEDLTGLYDPSGLAKAVSLYRGPFLHGLSVGDSPDFDEWMLFKGEEYRRSVMSLLEQLTSLHIERGESAEAARWARRQLELEPYREAAHRQLMAALALAGERPAALAHYEACRRLLAKELACEPDDKTQALYAQIRDGTFSWPQPTARRWDAALALAGPLSPPLPVAAGAPPRFVAREQELARLRTLLDQALAGQGGLALIAGKAGSGKTALLDEFARQAGAAHRDLIAVRGRCNAHGGAGDPYLPFREILQTLAWRRGRQTGGRDTLGGAGAAGLGSAAGGGRSTRGKRRRFDRHFCAGGGAAAALQEQSELCHRLLQQKGFAIWQEYAEVFLGWPAVMRGDVDGAAGIERMRNAIAEWEAKGMAVGTFRGHDGLVLPAVTPAKAGVQAPGRVSTDLDVALGSAAGPCQSRRSHAGCTRGCPRKRA